MNPEDIKDILVSLGSTAVWIAGIYWIGAPLAQAAAKLLLCVDFNWKVPEPPPIEKPYQKL